VDAYPARIILRRRPVSDHYIDLTLDLIDQDAFSAITESSDMVCHQRTDIGRKAFESALSSRKSRRIRGYEFPADSNVKFNLKTILRYAVQQCKHDTPLKKLRTFSRFVVDQCSKKHIERFSEK